MFRKSFYNDSKTQKSSSKSLNLENDPPTIRNGRVVDPNIPENPLNSSKPQIVDLNIPITPINFSVLLIVDPNIP